VFETEAGYIGLGSTAETGEPRIMLGYRNNLFRVRGAETRQEVEQWDAERGVAGMEVWADGVIAGPRAITRTRWPPGC
jgi:hypothetical protein